MMNVFQVILARVRVRVWVRVMGIQQIRKESHTVIVLTDLIQSIQYHISTSNGDINIAFLLLLSHSFFLSVLKLYKYNL